MYARHRDEMQWRESNVNKNMAVRWITGQSECVFHKGADLKRGGGAVGR